MHKEYAYTNELLIRNACYRTSNPKRFNDGNQLEQPMRTTLNINEALLARAMELTQISEKTQLVNVALEELIASFARKRLISLGGKDKKAASPPRRKVG
jgi:Arc/MetJ family transcription regulator